MNADPSDLSRNGRFLVVTAGFLGWLLAGVQLAVSSIVMREAAKSLLVNPTEAELGQWFGILTSGFLLGAAAGGYGLGWVGDSLGRKKAMALSIACYSLFAGLTYFANSPGQLLVLRFLTGIGVGGMWPNGIALVSEAWPNMSRPMLAGVIGTAANVGIMLFSILTCFVHVTTDEWRWVMLICFIPIGLAIFVALFVPESPRWLAAVKKPESSHDQSPLVEVFQTPLLRITLIAIALGTVPLFGGWGNANWANAWASQVGEATKEAAPAMPDNEEAPTADARITESQQRAPDPALKARAVLARSAPGSLASLLGGAVATIIGRRRCYFLLSFACFICSQCLFWLSNPLAADFLWWTGALGLFSGFFFGWLPLCLPELFPTRVRSTGAGIGFNFGRIATVIGILIASLLLGQTYAGNYAQIGRLTSLIYLLGMVVIWFTPDTSKQGLQD
ncbi:MAG: MFS transporter [Planctomycetaceae bacterium]|nr:MFS transporter [Planctomycetaceae bacterium]